MIIFYLKLKINLYNVLKKKVIHRPTSNNNLFCHFISNIISGPWCFEKVVWVPEISLPNVLGNSCPFPVWKWRSAECWADKLLHSLGFNNNPTTELPRAQHTSVKGSKEMWVSESFNSPLSNSQTTQNSSKLNEEPSYSVHFPGMPGKCQCGQKLDIFFSKGWDQLSIEIGWLIHFLLSFCLAPVQSYCAFEGASLGLLKSGFGNENPHLQSEDVGGCWRRGRIATSVYSVYRTMSRILRMTAE